MIGEADPMAPLTPVQQASYDERMAQIESTSAPNPWGNTSRTIERERSESDQGRASDMEDARDIPIIDSAWKK